ncbi:hypothetical protein FJZ39_04030 [Candidatus Saccharibacteria bacterium]|nr:hypothetical protein [Candidatus Saccharibacteria bacterium]
MKQWYKVVTAGAVASLLVALVAPGVNAAERVLEAENMYRDYGSQSVYNDRTASGGKKRILWTNGGAWGYLQASADFTTIEFRAKGDHWGSAYPRVDVWVDSKYVSSVNLDSQSWKTYSVKGDWSKGSHTVYFEYRNDYKQRNVHLDSAVAAGMVAPEVPTPAPTPEPTPAPVTNTGGTGGAKADQTFQTYSNGTYTSRYHLYAAGLDWSKPVGALIYADGSGEYGLKNPSSNYLLSGADGLIAVAKRNNMILLTPFAPNTACSDGDGSCWYLGDPVGYTKWAESLVTNIYGKYPIDTNRVAFGGYSSGAQLATEYWTPSGAAQRTMTDGVVVAISYGGAPLMTQTSTGADFKSKVHFNWNTGDKDEAYTRTDKYGVQAGYNAYTNSGYATSLDLIPGLGHDRWGHFGPVMEAQIKKHIQ